MDLYIATILLYSYRVRGAEQLRLKVKYFDFESSILTIPAQEMNAFGIYEDVLKNGEGARIELHSDDLALIKSYLGKAIEEPEFYLFAGHNKAGRKKCNDEFISQKFENFREKHSLPANLKWYALKHTANYNSSGDLTLEEQRILNRHKKDTTTIGYNELSNGSSYYNQAVSGNVIGQQRDVYEADVNKLIYDYVVIQLGVNNMVYGGDIVAISNEYQSLVNKVRTTTKFGCKIIVSTMTPCKQRLDEIGYSSIKLSFTT